MFITDYFEFQRNCEKFKFTMNIIHLHIIAKTTQQKYQKTFVTKCNKAINS